MEAKADRYLVVYGRKPVQEALASTDVSVAKVFVSQQARGDAIDAIVAAAAQAGVVIERVREEMVTAVSRNGRHHQGVAADVVAPGLEPLTDFLERRSHGRAYRTSVLVLDGVQNPANVGMIIRSALAAGLEGLVVPRRGTADLGPLVLKASAGVAFRAPLLRCGTAREAVELLSDARFAVIGLSAGERGGGPGGVAGPAPSLFRADLPERAAYVLGNESEGVSAAVSSLVERWLRIPLSAGVESLNVAAAATLVAYEIARRRDPSG